MGGSIRGSTEEVPDELRARADRIHRQLRRDGIRVGRKRVERLMAAQGWHGAWLRTALDGYPGG